jgi:hypothetical protein
MRPGWPRRTGSVRASIARGTPDGRLNIQAEALLVAIVLNPAEEQHSQMAAAS